MKPDEVIKGVILAVGIVAVAAAFFLIAVLLF